MESYCEGLFTLDELDGIDLKWGNADAIAAMVEKICRNEGIGAILAKGSRYAAHYFNRGFDFLVTASGIELPQHDAKFSPGLARTYQYDPTPGRHVKGGLSIQYGNEPPEVRYDYSNTGKRDVDGVVGQEIENLSGFCFMSGFTLVPDSKIRYIEAVTGWKYTVEEAYNIGLRSYTMRHAFNLREGFFRDHWDLPDRITGQNGKMQTKGPHAGVVVDSVRLANNFFSELGWNLDTAVPPREWFEKLNMADVADKLGVI